MLTILYLKIITSAQDSRNQSTAKVARNWIQPPLSISITIGLQEEQTDRQMSKVCELPSKVVAYK